MAYDYTHQVFAGDSKSVRLNLRWGGAPFDPTGHNLILTAKASLSDADASAKFQKTTGAGITVVDAARGFIDVALTETDTRAIVGTTVFVDVQAQAISGGAIKTVNDCKFSILQDATRAQTTSVPIHTSNPPVNVITLCDDTPEPLGVATSGTSSEAARCDHVHDMPSAADVGADAAGSASAAQAAAIAAAATDATTKANAAQAAAIAAAASDATTKANAAQAAAVQRANHTGTQSADTLTDGTTNKAFLATERTKLAGIASGATANATDAQLRDRATHTGTQSADTITDGTTNKAFTATEQTKLAGIAAGAEVNVNADWSSVAGDSQILNKPTLGDAAAKNTGTSAGTVAAGDDSRITGAAQKASNLSDLASAATAFGNIKQAATTSATGVVRLAAQADAALPTSDTLTVSPAVARDILGGNYLRFITPLFWTGVATGTGAFSNLTSYANIATGATAASVAAGAVRNMQWSAGQAQNTIDWTKAVSWGVRASIGGTQAANTVIRVTIGKSGAPAAAGALSVRGFGFEIRNQSLWAVVHDGTTLVETDLSTTVATGVIFTLYAAKTTAGVCAFYYNGALVGTVSGGPSSSTTSACNFFIEAVNTGSSASLTLDFGPVSIVSQ